jgi:uncharacterized repeat protein (TIGR02543 family)
MLKKFTWIAAALLAMLAMAFFGCTDGGLLDDGSKPVPENLPEVVLEGSKIALTKIGSGGGSAGTTVEGNKFKLDATGATGTGFAISFPDEVKGLVYKEVVVEMEVLEITSPDFISFNAKDDTNMANDVLIVGHTQQYHNEFKIGEITDKTFSTPCGPDCLIFTPGSCVKGAKGKAAYPYEKFAKGLIAFQYNPWAGDITNSPGSATLVSDFEIAVTKVTFVPYAGKPPEPVPPPVIPSYTGAAGKVTLDKKAIGRVDDEVVDADPSITASIGTVVSETGVATLTEGSVLYYKFPTSAIEGTGANAKTVDIGIEKDFDSIEFTFTITNVDKTSGGSGNFKVSVYNYDNDAEYGINPGASYQQYADFGTGTAPAVLETWGAFGSEGVAIRYNYGDRASSGADKMDVKLTKVTFKAKQRYKATFFVDSSPGVTYDIISGNTFNKSAIPASVRAPTKAGYKFAGWAPNADGTGTVLTLITDDTALYAKWTVDIPLTKPALDPVQVVATAGSTLFAATGSYADASAYTYTPPTTGATSLGAFWIVSDTRDQAGGYPDWSVGVVAPFNEGGGVTIRNAIKALQDSYGSGTPYTRIGIDFTSATWTAVTAGTESTSVDNPRFAAKWYDKVEITYNLVQIGGTTGVMMRNGPTGTSSEGTVSTPTLEAGTGKTLTVNMSALNGGVSFCKDGNAGAFLLQITKVKLSQE